MLAVYEMIDNENKQILNRGIKKGIKEMAKKMLKNKIDLKMVIEITGLSEEELLKIKNEKI